MARHRVDSSRITGESRAIGGKKGGGTHPTVSIDKPRGDPGRKGARAAEGKGTPDRAAPADRRHAGGDAFTQMTEGDPVGDSRDRSGEPDLSSATDREPKQVPARRHVAGQTKAGRATSGGTPPTPETTSPARKTSKSKATPAQRKKGGKED